LKDFNSYFLLYSSRKVELDEKVDSVSAPVSVSKKSEDSPGDSMMSCCDETIAHRFPSLPLKAVVILLAIVLCGFVAPVSAQISLNSVSSAKVSGNSSLSWNHTLASGTNRVVIIEVASNNASTTCGAGTVQSVSSVTFNGVAATAVPNSIACNHSSTLVAQTQLFYLTETLPASGSYAVSVKTTGTTSGIEAGVIALNGVAQGAPEALAINSTTGSTTISTSITTKTNGAWVVDVFGNGGASTTTAGSGQTQQWNLKGNATGAGSTVAMSTAGARTMSWTAGTAYPEAQTVASFAPSGGVTNYTLTTNVVGSGTIAANPSGGTYASGTVVTLTATPLGGWVFAGWSGDLSGATNPSNITMTANKSVTATFTQTTQNYTLTTNVVGSGTITLNPSGGTYASGTVVTVTATPNSGYTFSGWSGALSGTTNPANITMNANQSVTATFTQTTQNYTLTTSVVGSGTITLNPSGGTYVSGTVVTVTATPNSGYTFTGWSGALSGTTNPTTVTMTANKSVTATFTQNVTNYTLTTNVVGSGTITLNPTGGTYASGTVVTVTATPNSGYTFSGWSGALSGSTSPATVTMDANKSVTATFTSSSDTTPYATGDPRTVTQPTYPSVCTILSAGGTSSSGPDQTSALTSALSSCAGKGSVELQSSGANKYVWVNSFTMGSNQTLLIDAGVTLQGNSLSSQLISMVSGAANVAILGGPGTPLGAIDGHSSAGNRVLSQVNTNSNFTLYNVQFTHSGYPSIYIKKATGATIWGVQVYTTGTTHNADCIDIDSSSNVTVNNAYLSCGDDGIAVKTNSLAASNITVQNSSLHGSHGLSVGSQTFLGVTNVLFKNNYVYGKDYWGNNGSSMNAIRIKTDPSCGGHVDKVTYLNTCVTGTKSLIEMNTHYGSCSGTSGTPWFTNVVVNGVYSQSSASGAYSMFNGYDTSHLLTMWMANISLDNTTQSSSQDATIKLYNSNITPSGSGVTTSSFTTSGSVPVCAF
jgi:polygalacturonase